MESIESLELEPAVPLARPLLFFAGALVVAAILPHHDAARIVPGLTCSLVTEREASQALHADVMLEPSDGHMCRFVSADFAEDNLALVIVAREPGSPARAAGPPDGRIVVSRGERSALVWLEDRRDGPELRAQTERELTGLVATRLASER